MAARQFLGMTATRGVRSLVSVVSRQAAHRSALGTFVPSPSVRAMSQGSSDVYVACNVYVSEAVDSTVLAKIETAANECSHARLTYHFRDSPYNRSSYTLVGIAGPEFASSVAGVVTTAMRVLDLRTHSATHPRLGAVDHISCHPLQPTHALPAVAAVAHSIARAASAANADLPILMYGAAHESGARLRDLRRACGYFDGSATGLWEGTNGIRLGIEPQYGPSRVHDRLGMTLIGATPWIVNFNVLVKDIDLPQARKFARQVGERGGGLPAVEAMALPHGGGGIEIACNLLDTSLSSSSAVLARLEQLLDGGSGSIVDAYRIGKSIEELVSECTMHAA